MAKKQQKSFDPTEQFPGNRRFRVCVMSFFDGMLDHHLSLLQYAKDRGGQQTSDLLIMLCAYDRKAATTERMQPVLLSPDERWQMLKEMGYHNFLPVTVPPQNRRPAGMMWPTDPNFLVQQTELFIPGADVWPNPAFEDVLLDVQSHTGEHDFVVDKAFSDYHITGHDELREYIRSGRVSAYMDRQGYAFPVGGHVVKGNMIGHTLGYPTANLRIADHMKVLPAQGVYVAMVKVEEQWYQAMVNIGIRPTLDMDNVTIEAHLFDFDKDIYGKWISISFLDRIRDEMRFNSLADLKLQLDRDKETAKEVLAACLHGTTANAFIRRHSIRSS